MLFLYSPPRACVVSTRRAVVSTLSLFGRGVWTLHPSSARVAAFGLSSSAARKKGRACDTSNERANAAHAAKEQRGGGLLFPRGGAFVHVVYIRAAYRIPPRGALPYGRGFCLCVYIIHVRPRRWCCISCSFCIVSTRRARLYCIRRGGSRLVEALGRSPPAARYGAGLTM